MSLAWCLVHSLNCEHFAAVAPNSDVLGGLFGCHTEPTDPVEFPRKFHGVVWKIPTQLLPWRSRRCRCDCGAGLVLGSMLLEHRIDQIEAGAGSRWLCVDLEGFSVAMQSQPIQWKNFPEDSTASRGLIPMPMTLVPAPKVTTILGGKWTLHGRRCELWALIDRSIRMDESHRCAEAPFGQRTPSSLFFGRIARSRVRNAWALLLHVVAKQSDEFCRIVVIDSNFFHRTLNAGET